MKKCTEHNRKQLKTLVDQVSSLSDQSQHKEAIKILLHLEEYHMDMVETWFIYGNLGKCYYYEERYDEAADYLKLALESTGSDRELISERLNILDRLGHTYYRLYDHARALEYLHEAEKIIHYYSGREWAGNKYLHYLVKGRCQLQQEQFQAAYESFLAAQEAVRLGGDIIHSGGMDSVKLELGRALYYLKKFEMAEACLRSIIVTKLDKLDQTRMRYFLFRTLILLEKYDEALMEYDHLLSLGMEGIDRAEVYHILGILYFRQKRYDHARHNFDIALSLPTDSKWIHDDAKEYIKDIDAVN